MKQILNYLKGIELTDNDKELYYELLNLYLTETKFDVKFLNELILKSKEEAASYIHRIKGASRQIAAEKLALKGQQLEDVLKNKTNESLPLLINDFCKIYNDTINEIKKHQSNLNN